MAGLVLAWLAEVLTFLWFGFLLSTPKPWFWLVAVSFGVPSLGAVAYGFLAAVSVVFRVAPERGYRLALLAFGALLLVVTGGGAWTAAQAGDRLAVVVQVAALIFSGWGIAIYWNGELE